MFVKTYAISLIIKNRINVQRGLNVPNCIINGFKDIKCPYFNNPQNDCWYDLEYLCKKIQTTDSIKRKLVNKISKRNND
jgi:hypothetical protein